MYDQYKKDPKSVSPEWAKYFKTNGSGDQADGGSGGKAPAETKQSEAKQAEKKPKPEKSEAKAKAEEKPKQPEKKSEGSPAPKAKPRPETAAAEPAKGEGRPVAKDPKPPAPAQASDEPTYTILRGAPARTVQNMEASLTIPVATSVRTVPVKLLWDNRTVINNHLARARGGKVSFTHIIGYALIKALKTMPEMNVGYDVIDGKPNLVTPA
ncbi:MAG: 2-oxo acid dehydrogenase subunit E2, partial [Nocardioides sp.]